MGFLIVIVVAVVAFLIGKEVASQSKPASADATARQGDQSAKKAENKEKVLALAQEKGEIKNDDVEKLLGVSNATAERYLNELESEGKLTQHGKIGQGVFYTLKQ